MKSRQILFNTDMVQAILPGKKTQTRRMSGLNHINENPDDWQFEWMDYSCKKEWCFTQKSTINEESLKNRDFVQEQIKCPYGKVALGDELYVRETFYAVGYWAKDGWTKTWRQKYKFIDLTLRDGHQYIYKADETAVFTEKQFSRTVGWYKRNSIFMPRAASRITLNITNIRVERLNDISYEDAKAEGVEYPVDFYKSWESINGKYSWENNPWVWVLNFKMIKP